MRKYASVFALFARCSIYRIIGILILMAGTQVVLFHRRLGNAVEWVTLEISEDFSRLEDIVSGSGIKWVFGAAFLLITVTLSLSGTAYSSKTGYTLKRLNITERGVFFSQALYNGMVYVLLWAIEVIVCVLLCMYYMHTAPADTVSNQTVFLAFYRENFLHSLLPQADITPWVRNGFLLAALALSAAEFPFKQRRGKIASGVIALSLFALVFFVRTIGDAFNSFVCIGCAVILILGVLHTVYKPEEEEALSYVTYTNGE